MKKKTRRILIVILLLVFLGSSGMAIRDLLAYRKTDSTNRELAALMHAAEAEAEAETEAEPAPAGALPAGPDELPEDNQARVMLPQYRALHDRNPDFAGWLSSAALGIDLPVMYSEYDQNHYIRSDFDGNYLLGGTLFIGVPWEPVSNHAIIYGHKMKNGSMFGNLVRYAKEDFGAANPSISFDTLYRKQTYELFGAFYSKVYAINDTQAFQYYNYADLSDPEDFDYYVREVRAAALYDTGVVPEYGDTLLTLSTCDYYTENGRFVVVFRQVDSHTRKTAGSTPGADIYK